MVAAERGGVRVISVNRSAESAGVTPGLTLAAAGALCANLITAEADPEGDRRALAALADWCGRYTPWTALDESGGLWLEITGCGHLFGGEAELLADLGRRLDGFGYAHVAAVAETPGAAWATARYARPVADATLAPLPVAALRLPPATVEGLQRLGLRCIGDLIRLPRAPLSARFGPHLLKRLDQALGRCPEIIDPRRPTPAFRTRLAFAEPLIHRGGIEAALKQALDCLCRQMAAAEQGVRRLSFTLYRGDGSISEVAIGTSRPNRQPAHLARLFFEKLERLDPGFGVDVAILAAIVVDPLAPIQSDLASGGETQIAIDHLLDRLGNRLGPSRVLRLTSRASHLPERAHHAVSALDAPPQQHDNATTHAPRTPRPLRLLATPELIEVVAPVPDHPPALFRWRRHQHRVARAEGPERIGTEWWHNDPAELASPDQARARDYYRIEDTDGGRFWVFRNGPYRPDRPPRWYLHGFFS